MCNDFLDTMHDTKKTIISQQQHWLNYETIKNNSTPAELVGHSTTIGIFKTVLFQEWICMNQSFRTSQSSVKWTVYVTLRNIIHQNTNANRGKIPNTKLESNVKISARDLLQDIQRRCTTKCQRSNDYKQLIHNHWIRDATGIKHISLHIRVFKKIGEGPRVRNSTQRRVAIIQRTDVNGLHIHISVYDQSRNITRQCGC
jgi:hypothetical protein